MKKRIIYSFILATALLLLSACGSNSKEDAPDGGDVTSAPSSGFFNATTPLDITQINTKYEIKVQMIENGYVASGKTVQLVPFDKIFGSSANYSATTGADGYAIFNYTSPASLLADGTSIILKLSNDENGTVITQDIVLLFNSDGDIATDPLAPPKVVIPNDKKENTLTVNNQLMELGIKVFDGETNAPYSEGKVKVELPSKIITGVDIGSFEAYEVPIVNGIASFKYTGPNNLKSLVDSGDLSSTFLFYHEKNIIDKKSVVMNYDPDPDSGYIPANYELVISSQDGDMTMGLEEEKTFSVLLKNDQGNEVSGSSITSMTITSKNTFIAKLLDNGTESDSITISGQNPVSFNVRTNIKSGLLPVDIVVNFVDPNGISKEMKQTINIVVYSGPATAMSISYVGVEQDTNKAKYIEKFAVTVVDAYNNKVNTKPNIAVGGMVEYAVDGSSTTGERTTTSPRLWYGKSDTPYGSIVPIGGSQTTFDTPAGGKIFQYIDFDNDRLVLFGEGYVYESLGKWDITPNTDDSLSLNDDYFGEQRDNLFYAVGHNKRQDLCADDGREYIGAAKSDTYQIDSEGTALIEFEYDYHLTGKDIMLWVNLSGYQADTDTTTRIGEARAHTLRGNGLVTDVQTIAAGSVEVPILFNIAHENASEWYKNGHFGFVVTTQNGCTVHNVIDSSNFHYDTNGVKLAVKDARACDNEGVAYVLLNVSSLDGGPCQVTLDNIVVSDEF